MTNQSQVYLVEEFYSTTSMFIDMFPQLLLIVRYGILDYSQSFTDRLYQAVEIFDAGNFDQHEHLSQFRLSMWYSTTKYMQSMMS